jgi:hypothetical protein
LAIGQAERQFLSSVSGWNVVMIDFDGDLGTNAQAFGLRQASRDEIAFFLPGGTGRVVTKGL